jgi:tRNA 2-thiouridine synthesizing protein A
VSDDPAIVDARGHRCPVPSLRLRRALQDHPETDRFVLLATDSMARIDVPFLMEDLGGAVLEIAEAHDHLAITVSRRAVPPG